MENTPNLSDSTPGSTTPLNACSPERVNQQRPQSALFSSFRSEFRDSSVHEKISQFNSLATQSKQLERKAADAALTRALLGREEAESDARRFREETKSLKRSLDESRDREKKVSQRMEQVMVRRLSLPPP